MKVKGYLDTIKWYDNNAKHYAKIGDLNIDTNHLDAFSEAMSKSDNYVLDAGCGYG